VVTHDARVYAYGDRIIEMADGRITSVRSRADFESGPHHE
jgi:ABC-type lipoprotein export system ATPase subunit